MKYASPSQEEFRSCPVSKAERRWVWGFAVVVMLVTTLPYLVGYAAQTAGWRFSGFVFGVEDGNSYIAKMLSGTAGAWLFRTPYTVLPQQGVLMYLPYLLLGKLAAPPGVHEQLVALYHLFRLAAGFLAILASYDFLALFVNTVRLRRFGLALITLGGGLGWLLVLVGRSTWLGSLPLEFYSPETFGFLGLYGLPHLALARALLLWSLVVYIKSVANDPLAVTGRQVLKLGLLWLLAGLFQPLAILVIGAVIGLHLLALAVWQIWRVRSGQGSVDWRRWWQAVRFTLLAALLPACLALYSFWSIARDQFLQIWSAQNIITSPNPLHYLLAYGLLLPFAWVGGRYLLRLEPWRAWLPVAWVLALPVLAYAPLNLQRRLPEGVWVAIVTLAMAALESRAVSSDQEKLRAPREQSMPVIKRFPSFGWAAAILLLAFPSTLLLLAGGLLAVVRPEQPAFIPVPESAAFLYLSQHATPETSVLTAYESGNSLPAWAPFRVVIGHGPESANLAQLRPQVEAFYAAGTPDTERQRLLDAWRVQYVFWGPDEQRLGGFDPHMAAYLKPVYQAGAYEVFEVSKPVS